MTNSKRAVRRRRHPRGIEQWEKVAQEKAEKSEEARRVRRRRKIDAWMIAARADQNERDKKAQEEHVCREREAWDETIEQICRNLALAQEFEFDR